MNVCEKCGNPVDKSKFSKWASGRFCSRKCSNSRTMSIKTREIVSKKLKGNRPWNAGTASTCTRTCVTCKKTFTTIGWNKKKTCSDECMRYAPGRNGGYRPNSTRKIRSEYKGYWMDSGAERKFAELLDENNIRWIKNTKKFFPYRDKTGKKRKYYPDFYLPEYDYWVEIKGLLYAHENDLFKLKAVGSNIELQMHNEIRLPRCINYKRE